MDDPRAAPLQSLLSDSFDTTPEIRSLDMARRCVVVGLLFALIGAVGACVEIHGGVVSGPEAWLILASIPMELGLLSFALLARSRTVVVAIVTIVYYTIHLCVEIVVTIWSGTHQLHTLTFLVWFFPLLILNKLINSGRAARVLSIVVATAPIIILIFLTPRLLRNCSKEQLEVIVGMELSYLLYSVILNMVTRYREAYIIARDRSDPIRLQALATEHLAFYDQLTGLPNRFLIRRRMKEAMVNSVNKGTFGALLFLDLDHFKTLNDTLGHQVGDSLLQAVAERLLKHTPPGATVARLGGDEFVVLLEDLGRTSDAAAASASIATGDLLRGLQPHYYVSGYEWTNSPSIGIAMYPEGADSVDNLLKRADIAMYRAKSLGRNRFCLFNPQLQTLVSERAALETDLRNALRDKQLSLVYQPQVDSSLQVTGAEALLRWKHPARGPVPPAEFIPVAEETGLILEIGQWVLRTACEQLARWASHPATCHLCVSVNISMRQLLESTFAESVIEVLSSTGADPHLLTLELTESAFMEVVEESISKMQEVRALGVRFSLDDFGTGYSSLSRLGSLPLDELKVDKGLVDDLAEDAKNTAIARAIIILADEFGLKIIAEGVETESARNFLLQQGCCNFQGYFFSRPLTIAHLEILLRGGSHAETSLEDKPEWQPTIPGRALDLQPAMSFSSTRYNAELPASSVNILQTHST